MMTPMAIRFGLTALVVWTAVSAGCGRQVGDDYLGEPLLSLRGQVTSSALTGSPQARPALCFLRYTGDFHAEVEGLPAEVREAVSDENLVQGDYNDLSIVNVESRGDFPAEFAIEVFVPPDAGALAPLVTGEPASAFGFVCAVTAEHAARVRGLRTLGRSECYEEEGCAGLTLRTNHSTSRYYIEHFKCPADATSQSDCEVRPEGDATLKQENGGYESVLQTNSDVSVIYLAEPAAPGSYTAYKAGAPDGLAAGYHVRTYPNLEGASEPCFNGWTQAALAELNAENGTTYEGEYELYTAGIGAHLTRYRDISARIEMEVCPIDQVTSEQAGSDGLSIAFVDSSIWREPQILLTGQP